MRAPGFSKVYRRNTERWKTYDMSVVPPTMPQMERPCFMPMRHPQDHTLLSGVVYLDYDAKEFDGRTRKKVRSLLRDDPKVEWAGFSSGDGVLALAWEPDLAGMSLAEHKSNYKDIWDELTESIERSDRPGCGQGRTGGQSCRVLAPGRHWVCSPGGDRPPQPRYWDRPEEGKARQGLECPLLGGPGRA